MCEEFFITCVEAFERLEVRLLTFSQCLAVFIVDYSDSMQELANPVSVTGVLVGEAWNFGEETHRDIVIGNDVH